MHPFLHIATEAAREAGKIIMRGYDRLDTIKIEEKSQNSLVSEIDKNAEEKIIQMIRKAHPKHSILGEESGALPGDDEVCWIIDPLDGTTNFLHGIPQFSVSIGVRYKGKLQVGVVYDPLKQELFTASLGEGARLNDKRIRVRPIQKLSTAIVGTGFPISTQNLKPFLKVAANLIPQCHGLRRMGSAALDLAYVACGRFDGFFEFGLKPWDIAAGILLVQEAGGLVTDLVGGNTCFETGNILAASPYIHEEMQKIIAVNV